MQRPTIQRINSLKGLPVFAAYTAPTDLLQFRRHNLIYGFNGCGKTTLSRVLASLGSGIIPARLSNGGSFDVLLSDGTRIQSDTVDQSLSDRVVVFNEDFIEDNLRWKDGTANPLFYIGKEQADLSENLTNRTAEFEGVVNKRKRAEVKHKAASSLWINWKRDKARLIEEQVGLGRRYDARRLDSDYASNEYGSDLDISEEERQKQRSIITQEEALPELKQIVISDLALARLIHDTRIVLATTVGTISITELGEHDTMLKWVKDGMEYHEAHGLKICLFCGNTLTEARLQALANAIDERYEQLVQGIEKVTGWGQKLKNDLANLQKDLPGKNDIAKEHQATFSSDTSALMSAISEATEAVGDCLRLLSKKAERPNAQIDLEDLATDVVARQREQELLRNVAAVNGVITAHNETHDNFKAAQEAARSKLKEHYLADGQGKYRTLQRSVGRTKALVDGRRQAETGLDETIEELKHKLRQHGPAAEHINNMLFNYLGHKELQIVASEEGYEIRRNGQIAKAPPSEGEKTAIALCYFLVSLQADGRQIKDLIVVVDDPVSSLDTRSLNYAFNLIRAALEGAAQVVIMTHNLNFMNEVKKWLKPRTERELERSRKPTDDATAALYFIDMIQPSAKETRESSIIEMPKYIREYESEYHYLFHLMLRFLHSPDDQLNYFFVMPNAFRKILDVFLAFKEPGGMGFLPKLEKVAKIAGGKIDHVRIQALERLLQVESHADNLDDLVAVSSMTIEETKEAAETILDFMEAVDKVHHDRMCKLCRP